MEKKHFTSKDVPTNFAHKHGSPNAFWIVLISVVFFLFLVFSKWNKIEQFFGLSLEQTEYSSDFVLGEEISVEGLLTQDWDFITHTHKLSTLSSGVFGLKSKTINLNQYSGTVLVEGFVDTEHQWLYIIDVTKIIAQTDEEVLTGDLLTGAIVGHYLPQAWIYLLPSFFENYTLVSTGNNVIKITSLTTNETINIDYFLCKKWNSNTDCKQLSTTFADSNEKTFTTQYGTVFYKLSEVKSWFFNNQELFGYFINNTSEEEILKLSSFLILPTAEYIKNVVEPKISSLCKEGNIVMNSVTKTTLSLDQGKIVALLFGNWENWTAECSLIVDPSLPTFWTLKSFLYKEAALTWTVESPNGETPVINQPQQPTQKPTDVAQFQINLEKALVFTSSRWHSISFPSPKISYKSDSISENLGLAWVNCYVATKVIEYTKKDLIDSEPTVIVYECKIKENVDLPYEYYAKSLSDGRTFVVSVINPAWHDFANNIQVMLNQ